MAGLTRTFISYGRGDDRLKEGDAEDSYHYDRERSFTRRLYEDLNNSPELKVAGISLWWDRQDLPARGLSFNHEIRDAIKGCGKMILVVGEKGMASDYVKAEWEHAQLYCLEVIPILRNGDYPLIPEPFRKTDAVDFRDLKVYDLKLKDLIRKLCDLPAEMGKLHGVRELPEWYIERRDDLRDVSAKLRSDAEGPVVVSSTKGKLLTMLGMGGIGKSMLAAALCHNCGRYR